MRLLLFVLMLFATWLAQATGTNDEKWNTDYTPGWYGETAASTCQYFAQQYVNSGWCNVTLTQCVSTDGGLAEVQHMSADCTVGPFTRTTHLHLLHDCEEGYEWDEDTQACVEQFHCDPPYVLNTDAESPLYGFCYLPPQCEGTIGQSFNGNPGPVGPGPAYTCVSGCRYAVSDFIFTSADYGYYTFTGNGEDCIAGQDGDETNPLPDYEPTPDQTPEEPTDPLNKPEVAEDGNTTDEPATDENQETLSRQLDFQSSQLSVIEKNSGAQALLQSDTNGLLTEIAKNTQGLASGLSLDGNNMGNAPDGDGDGDVGEFDTASDREAADDFETTMATYWQAIQDAPIVSGFNLAGTGATGTCPTGSFSYDGSTFTFDSHCQLIEDIKPLLQAAMMFAWTLLAVRIVLSS